MKVSQIINMLKTTNSFSNFELAANEAINVLELLTNNKDNYAATIYNTGSTLEQVLEEFGVDL